jgi:hypothetical protein
MAPIKCHECSGRISDPALTCPHCGAPVVGTVKRRQKAILIELGFDWCWRQWFVSSFGSPCATSSATF